MRYKLIVSYIGTNYSGFQIQNNKKTIQQILQDILSKVCQLQITVIASGRTDAGVSAISQVCHFDTSKEINEKKCLSYSNSLLPKDIRILSIEKVDDNFHARYNAKQKTYDYFFYVGMENSVYESFATHVGINLDIQEMINACQFIIGEHDFSCFCASNTNVKDKVRIIYDCKIIEVDEHLYKLEITGNGFLYNMVRIIVGTLVMVGQKKLKSSDIVKIINMRDRSKAGKTMPSKGLILKKVVY